MSCASLEFAPHDVWKEKNMSAATHESAAPHEGARPGVVEPPDLRIYAHSSLLYWWPVWAVALMMALWTAVDNYHMVLIPEGATIEDSRTETPLTHVARSRVPGVLFALTLVTVAIFSNSWIRGAWALFLAATCAAVLLFISWVRWWEPLLLSFNTLKIYINLGGYLFIGLTLLVAWVAAVFVFDRRTYLVFSVGQVRFRDELGAVEKAYDTTGILFEKRQFDWFRWLVGLGAGDLVIRTGGASPHVR